MEQLDLLADFLAFYYTCHISNICQEVYRFHRALFVLTEFAEMC